MKKLLLILLCLFMIGLGQGWETTFANINTADLGDFLGYGNTVEQTTDRGYIICASGKLIKTDGNGVAQWSQTLVDY